MRMRSIAVATITALMIPATMAVAHDPEQKIVYWKASSGGITAPCAQGMARIAHGNYGKGFARSNTWSISVDYVYAQPCATPNWKSAGQIRAHFAYDVKRNGAYAYCDNSPWVNNGGAAYMVEVFRNYANRPCGQAWYRTIGAHAVYANGNWRNGLTNSGEHYFG